MPRASYHASLEQFIVDTPEEIIGKLSISTINLGFATTPIRQIDAWITSIDWLKEATRSLQQHDRAREWTLVLEYNIPRRQKRIDVVLLTQDTILLMEFKTGNSTESLNAKEQVEDYALDLRDFHAESRSRKIVPIVVQRTSRHTKHDMTFYHGVVAETIEFSVHSLSEFLEKQAQTIGESCVSSLNPMAWIDSAYAPVPTIIESARALYGNHSVREITHAAAGVENLARTSRRVRGIISETIQQGNHSICFVTGVPGSGKTLAGLNAAHEAIADVETPPVFLTGNGPLVKIVGEALALDERSRTRCTMSDARRKVSTFVQNVHSFMKYYWDDARDQVPNERVAIFDEAQRAWSAKKNQRKFGRNISEPEMMLEIMGRHTNGAVIVALIGEGQEIHDGEAGLEAWWHAISSSKREWKVFLAEATRYTETHGTAPLISQRDSLNLQTSLEPDLHLRIPVRSIQSQNTAEWVNRLLKGDIAGAAEISENLPIRLSRDLDESRAYLSTITRGTRRSGLVASSDAIRLRAYGIEMSTAFHGDYPIEHWFLGGRNDIRSSFSLEFAASEFECQGLEIDNVLMCWCNDLNWDLTSRMWQPRKYVGKRWNMIRSPAQVTYGINKYRVLLTRFRESMLIWIPRGKQHDTTIPPAEFELTASILEQAGLRYI